jgi:hypothetical protein
MTNIIDLSKLQKEQRIGDKAPVDDANKNSKLFDGVPRLELTAI